MNKKIISVIIVVLIALAIFGVWLIRNKEKGVENKNTTGVEEKAINPDFEFEITKDFDIEKLKSYNLPIMLDFGADYCMPCRQMEFQGKAIIRKIDVWNHPEFAEGYPVELIPTQVFINSDGTPFISENASSYGLEYITDENGKHTLTIHVGMLTLDEMKVILKEMGVQ